MLRFLLLLIVAVNLAVAQPTLKSFSSTSSAEVLDIVVGGRGYPVQSVGIWVGKSCFFLFLKSVAADYTLYSYNFFTDQFHRYEGKEIDNGYCNLKSGLGFAQIISSEPTGPNFTVKLDLAYAHGYDPHVVIVQSATDNGAWIWAPRGVDYSK